MKRQKNPISISFKFHKESFGVPNDFPGKYIKENQLKRKKKKRKMKSLLPALHKSKKGGTTWRWMAKGFVCTPSHPITNFFLSFPLFSISQKGKRETEICFYETHFLAFILCDSLLFFLSWWGLNMLFGKSVFVKRCFCIFNNKIINFLHGILYL